MKTVVCLGASLTVGTISFNYVHLLESRPTLADYKFLNHGVNGDLAWNGLQRLDAVIAEEPDFVAILIGTNDVNSTLSPHNYAWYRNVKKPPQEPSLTWFESVMGEMVGKLKLETGARLALLSLAVIGEDLKHEANRQIERHNEAIRRVADGEQIAYLPLYERMVAYLREHEADRAQLTPMLAHGDGLENINKAIALHASGLSWDEVSRRNGLLLTTDCLHLNSVGAGMAADLIEGWLKNQSN